MADTRRAFLALAGAAPLALLAERALAQPAACYDPSKLPLSQRSRRRAAGYVEPSPDPAKHCSACSFFAAGDPGCGICGFLEGPVSAGAVCSSFSAKAAK